MCRLYGFRANELTKVECTLVHAQNALLAQSRHDAIGRRHADGWGIACYGDPGMAGNRLPELVRHETAAFDDTQFSHKAETMYAQTVVAHVRLATVGYVGVLNSHPFTHDNWTFAHNGTLPGFDRLEAQLAQETGSFQDSRLGATDSEQVFLWLLHWLEQDGVNLEAPTAADLTDSITAAVLEIDRRCRELDSERSLRLTFLLTNGRMIVGCRWNNPLYWLDRRGIHDCEICGIPHIRHASPVDYRAIVFASEPMTTEAWKELANHSLAIADEKLQLNVTSLAEGAPP